MPMTMSRRKAANDVFLEYTGGTGSWIIPPADRAIKIYRKSPAYFRLMMAGFDLPDATLVYSCIGVLYVSGEFRCICGRSDSYSIILNTIPRGAFDVATFLEETGAVSARHLKFDGFTPAQIRSIRKAYV